jgi:hypothetical protein
LESIRKIDHIVYAVPDLDLACDQIEKALGPRPIFGGYHPLQGTQNALLNLSHGCYLELLAIDKDNMKIKSPRWMGIDLINRAKITRWALKSNFLTHDQEILNAHPVDTGPIKGGERKTTTGELLKWELIMPLPSPEVDVVPFMVNWSDSAYHPTDQLQDLCKIKSFRIFHPDSATIYSLYSKLGIQTQIIQSDQIRIELKISGPNGDYLIN